MDLPKNTTAGDTADLEEFFQRVDEASDRSNVKKGRVPRNDMFDDEATDGPKQGKLTQWALFADGFMATTQTVKTVPAGVYSIESAQQGIWLRPRVTQNDEVLRLPDGKSAQVIEEINRFWKLKENFGKFGFSHKRGFMLYGPPGSGKTFTVAAVIEDLVKMGGCVLLADHPGLLSAILTNFRSVEPQRPIIVVWEDIDAVIENYGESEVLAILDGELQVDNICFVATTNYPERLDKRIVNRPSRFDKIIKIDVPNDASRKMYLEKKLGAKTVLDGVDLVKETKGMSFAHLRELVVGIFCFGEKPEDVVRRLKGMTRTPKSEETGPMGLGV